MPRTIVITGASSGIGEALALSYARDGSCLGLSGRDIGRLDRTAEQCRSAGAVVSTAAIDVRAHGDMEAWLQSLDDKTPIDLLIANAGVMAGSAASNELESAETARALMATNVLGVMNTVQPILPRMIARRRGQIAIVSSIAAFLPVPDAPSYGASKAAVLNYGLALRSLLRPQGIGVSVICPGYVDTPMMHQEAGSKPSIMPPEKAAEIIRRGLMRDRAVIAFPPMFALITRIGGLLPDRLRRWTNAPFRFTVKPYSRPDREPE
jgi:short-subunit dehydrogenase